jgi:hypothetical protein
MGDVPAAILEDRDFVVDFARYSEGILDEKFLRRKYRFAESIWESLGEDDALVKLIEDEKLRRIRDGSSKREKAQMLVVKAPDTLSNIMLDPNGSAKAKIDAAGLLDRFAANGPQAGISADRFIIQITIGETTEHYSKAIAVTTDDPDDISGAPQLTAVTADKSTDKDNEQPV